MKKNEESLFLLLELNDALFPIGPTPIRTAWKPTCRKEPFTTAKPLQSGCVLILPAVSSIVSFWPRVWPMKLLCSLTA